MDFTQIGKLMIMVGGILLIAGIVLMLATKYLPLGRFPGDILIKKKNFTFYFPLVSSIILSIIITIIWNLLKAGK